MKWTAERRAIRDDSRRLLAGLGGDAGQVAASLESEGVQGQPRNTQGCAIAVYLAAVVGADHRVRAIGVDGRHLRIRLESRWRPAVVVRLPAPVRDFVADFDGKRFPSLIRGARSQPAPASRQPLTAGTDTTAADGI